MFQPSTCDPETVHGDGRNGGAGFEQTPTALPVTEPSELPPPAMLPFDHTSPTRLAVPLPVKVSEPAHVGLSVWIAAPFAPTCRASAVAVAPTVTYEPKPSTCIMAMPTEWLAVAVKVTPAIEWSADVTVRI